MGTTSSPELEAERRDPPTAPSLRAPEAEQARGGAFVRIVRLSGVIALMAALGYLGGRIHGGFEASRAEARLRAESQDQKAAFERAQADQQQALLAARADAQKVQNERAQLTDLVALYEAYRTFQHVLDALDAHNFGIAESELREAQQLLTPLAARTPALRELLGPLSQTKIVVASDLAEQRQALAVSARQLDQLIRAQRAALGLGAGATK